MHSQNEPVDQNVPSAPVSEVAEGVSVVSRSLDTEPRKEQIERFYRPELDWLRFVAFSAVFVSHALPYAAIDYNAKPVPLFLESVFVPFAQTGCYGVDLFFALSAFLITELLLREKEATGRVHIGSFYVRRMLRIWPLYFTFILVTCPLEVWLRGNQLAYYASLLGFAGNWYAIFFGGGFWSACLPLWSVCVEEHFYILWPNIVGRANISRFAKIMIGLLVFTSIYRALYIYSIPREPWCVWVNTFSRLDPFALGGLLAILLHNRTIAFSRFMRVCVLFFGIGMFWFLGTFPEGAAHGTSPVWSYSFAALASVLCILAAVAAPPRRNFSRLLRVLSYLGKISYGLYVFHLGAMMIASIVMLGQPEDSWNWMRRTALAGVLTLIASMLSYAWLEKPFLKLKERFAYVQSRPA